MVILERPPYLTTAHVQKCTHKMRSAKLRNVDSSVKEKKSSKKKKCIDFGK